MTNHTFPVGTVQIPAAASRIGAHATTPQGTWPVLTQHFRSADSAFPNSADLAPLPQSSELRLSETQERLMTHEQRCGEQSKLIAELTVKAEQNAGLAESLKEKLHQAASDQRNLEGRLAAAEEQRQEAEQQRRELMGISGRKEEMVQRLQGRVEELVQELAGLSAQLEAAKADARRQADHIRDRASSKVRV